MLNLSKPLRHQFRKNVTVKFLGDCGDSRWPLVFGITDTLGTQVIQTNRNGAMTCSDIPVIQNASETHVLYVNIYRNAAGQFSLGTLHPTPAEGQLELTFEDSKLMSVKLCS